MDLATVLYLIGVGIIFILFAVSIWTLGDD